MNSEARFLIVQARVELLFNCCFYGALAMRLRLVEDEHCMTMYTDGEIIGYNPFYVLSLTPAQLQWSVAHECNHCAFGHMWRRCARQMQHWNFSCDAVINPICSSIQGLDAPPGVINEPTCVGKSAEWAYAHLPKQPSITISMPGGQGQSGGQGQQSPSGGKSGKGKQQHGGCGCDGVRDAPTGAGAPTEAEWQVAVTQAANAARAAGQLPSSLEHLVGKLEAPRVDWRAALRRFVQEFSTSDYSWSRPNRKYIPAGIYLPTLRSEQMPAIAVIVDTSGSISESELVAFFSEMQSIVDECAPIETHVIQCDASVKTPHDILERGDAFKVQKIKVHGRGGTAFSPAFKYVEEQGIEPACLIYLTDLQAFDQPCAEPSYPTLWVSTVDGQKGWFADSETIYLNDGGVRGA